MGDAGRSAPLGACPKPFSGGRCGCTARGNGSFHGEANVRQAIHGAARWNRVIYKIHPPTKGDLLDDRNRETREVTRDADLVELVLAPLDQALGRRLNSILLRGERPCSGSVGEVVERAVGANNAARLLTCLAVANSLLSHLSTSLSDR